VSTGWVLLGWLKGKAWLVVVKENGLLLGWWSVMAEGKGLVTICSGCSTKEGSSRLSSESKAAKRLVESWAWELLLSTMLLSTMEGAVVATAKAAVVATLVVECCEPVGREVSLGGSLPLGRSVEDMVAADSGGVSSEERLLILGKLVSMGVVLSKLPVGVVVLVFSKPIDVEVVVWLVRRNW